MSERERERGRGREGESEGGGEGQIEGERTETRRERMRERETERGRARHVVARHRRSQMQATGQQPWLLASHILEPPAHHHHHHHHHHYHNRLTQKHCHIVTVWALSLSVPPRLSPPLTCDLQLLNLALHRSEDGAERAGGRSCAIGRGRGCGYAALDIALMLLDHGVAGEGLAEELFERLCVGERQVEVQLVASTVRGPEVCGAAETAEAAAEIERERKNRDTRKEG